MDGLPFTVAGFQLFLVCLARMAAMIGTLPVFGSGTAPARVRIGLAVMLALLIFPVVRPYLPPPDFSPVTLGLLILGEALLGLMVGFIAQLVLTSVEVGGTIIGYKMGFAAANVFDPQSQRQIELISQYQNVIAVLIFLALDAHHLFLRAVVRSYELLPPGGIDIGGDAVPFLMTLVSRMFVLGIQLSAPILAVLILASLVMGILARVFPQLNVFMLSFPLNIGVGFLVMGLTLSLLVLMLEREFGIVPERILHLIQTFR
ncbi:flagellar biosynthetic protein FliR [Trichloromonas acetexigens]|jgi:flagellar biosynthetic protein FliR|uniref:Flagellar biosynthetic protein FliR n=1 Tax=Trichloromonas acetexigens TaxID=38815 RepID=A0A550JIS6_9BACT|nr:flagellar biosynthetic protein FliR [Desulfuromonas acetexigens]TRO83090.1 flagellar biosynthetic protein FliR [Desulfuromonas acetexigens]